MSANGQPTITIRCQCGREYRLPEARVGKNAKCRECGARGRVQPLGAEGDSPFRIMPPDQPTSAPDDSVRDDAAQIPGEEGAAAPTRQPLLRRLDLQGRLVVLSCIWAALVALIPLLAGVKLAFIATACLIAVNLGITIWALVKRGKLLGWLTAAQLPLFCVLNYQLYQAFGAAHYSFDAPPTPLDWLWLSCVHFFKAADVLDGIDAYGEALNLDLMNVRHASVAAGLLLVWMHLTIDLFLIGLLVRLAFRYIKRETDPEEARRRRAELRAMRNWGLAYCVLVVLVVGFVQGWRGATWYLWPLDNALRTVDVGDFMQIFHLRLHAVPMGVGTTMLALAFRLVVGLFAAEQIALRVPLPKSVDEFIDDLSSEHEHVRLRAATALGNFGADARKAIPALARALADRDSGVRRVAAIALERIGADATDWVPGLVRALADSDSAVRSRAAKILAEIGQDAKSAVPALVRALQDGDARVRAAVAKALGEIGADAKEAVSALARALADHDSGVRRVAANALKRIGASTIHRVPGLVRALADSDSAVRLRAAKILAEIGQNAKSAVPALVRALQDGDARVRAAVAKALGKIGADGKEAVSALARALADKDWGVRDEADYALRYVGPRTIHKVPGLVRALSNKDPAVRSNAAEALGTALGEDASMGGLDPLIPSRVVPALANRLMDECREVRFRAMEALGAIGADAKDAVPALVRTLADEDQQVRLKAMAVLGAIGAEAKEAVPALARALADKDQSLRRLADSALRKIGASAIDRVAPLVQALADDDWVIRQHAAASIGTIGTDAKDAVPALTQALADTHSAVRSNAARALGKIGGEAMEAVPALVWALADRDWRKVGWAAEFALIEIGPRAIDRIVPLLENDDPVARANAANALGTIGADAKDAVPALIRALSDQDPRVRLAAEHSLLRVDPTSLERLAKPLPSG